MSENQEFIYESLLSQILMGFLPIDEIKESVIEEIEDNGFENEISKEWAYQKIDDEAKKLFSESKNWKKPTDTEKLISAFDKLCKMKIIALHCAGYTTSDGEYEVVEVERKLNEEGITSIGYCYYHEQALNHALGNEDSNLYLAFQKINNSDDKITVEVGKKIVEVLKSYDFNIEWEEIATTKILIKNFSWQKIYNDNDRDLLDYDEVVQLMIG